MHRLKIVSEVAEGESFFAAPNQDLDRNRNLVLDSGIQASISRESERLKRNSNSVWQDTVFVLQSFLNNIV